MISKSVIRYHTDPVFRAGMLLYGREYERRHRTERNAWKRRYRRNLTAGQKRLARAACRRCYIKNCQNILAKKRAARVAAANSTPTENE